MDQHGGAARPGVPEEMLAGLRVLLGDRLSVARGELERHGGSESWHRPEPPDAVAFAESTAEVEALVRLCAAHRVPVVPFGAGTSLEGHVAARAGGVCVDLSRMTRIVAVRPEDGDCTVEAGVTREQLNLHLRDTGLFFPVDPGAPATIGGMAATRASGTNAVRYGTIRDVVLSLTAVMADGRVVRTGGRARKSASGYDLTRLLIGSEGTLGVITELSVRLFPIPEMVAAAVCPFGDVRGAVDCVIALIQQGVRMARIEFLDAAAIRAVNRYSGLANAEAPTLFLEFNGTEAEVAAQVAAAGEACAEHGGGPLGWATRAEDRQRLWTARHQALWAVNATRPGCRGWTTDVCVPISRLADCLVETTDDMGTLPFPGAIVGHVGDGNFHCLLPVGPEAPDDLAAAARFNERLVRRALAMEGTCSGEHGVGLGKRSFMADEHGEGLAVMRAIKRALDPLGILNPGKVLPDEAPDPPYGPAPGDAPPNLGGADPEQVT